MTPAPLPEPPSDYARLAERFPVLRKENMPSVLYRVHRTVHEPEWFSATGEGRWDPPVEAVESFGTCYAAADEVTALMEAVGELPLLTEAMLDRRALAAIVVPADQAIADMTNAKIVGEWDLDRRISVGDDYGVCQRWAHALRLAGFTGVFYEPRHDPRDERYRSLALFGDPGYQPTQVIVVEDEPIPGWVIQRAREDFGLRIAPTAPLLPPPADPDDDG